jgi:hypothetical protein
MACLPQCEAQPDRRIAGIINPLELISQLPGYPNWPSHVLRRPRGLNRHLGQLTAPRASRLHAAAAAPAGNLGASSKGPFNERGGWTVPFAAAARRRAGAGRHVGISADACCLGFKMRKN